MKNFQELKVWKLGMQILKEIYEVSSLIPEKEKFGLISQITRANVSIPSIVAEGSSRDSDKDYKRFLEMELVSAFELEIQLLILKEIEYLKYTEILSLLEMIKEEQKMLQGFIKKLKTTS